MNEIGRGLWLRERRKGIGGTDAAAILGLSKYANEHDVWLAKLDLAPATPDTEAMWWGRELEDVVARKYMAVTGKTVFNPERLLYHPDYPVLIGSPDRICVDENRGLEIKTTNAHSADNWGPSGSDEIPPAYVIQCMHYMAITGFDKWDIAVLIGGSEFRHYTIKRNPDLEATMVTHLNQWWKKHIVDGITPEITSSPATKRWLEETFPYDVAPMREADAYAEDLASRIKTAKAIIDRASKNKDDAEAAMKALIGDASGIKGLDWTITWKRSKDSKEIDWESVAKALANELESVYKKTGYAEEVLSQASENNYKVRSGSRRFLLKSNK